ncbi:phospholipase A [Parasalinivibrio latis]|uniref:phospholipase A n=1 Tax=Parasalinivibrio latis TaxID=2952610 RepID=UPI0030DE1203
MKRIVFFHAGLLCLVSFGVLATGNQPSVFTSDPSSQPVLQLEPYQDNYMLPVYFTEEPAQQYYAPQNPNGGKTVGRTNLQFQLSVKFGLFSNLLTDNDDVYVAYTQRSNWQAYAKSAYFRDTQYQPELFWVFRPETKIGDWTVDSYRFGMEHQSNGKGGFYERSWNRAYADITLKNSSFCFDVKPWVRLHFGGKDYNPDIMDYMGYGKVSATYTIDRHQFKLMLRNQAESGFSKGFEQLSWNFPIVSGLHGYMLLQSGYGAAISDYNHYDNAIGVGVSFF